MTTQERLQAFFEAENARDFEAYRMFLHPDVVWRLFGSETKTMTGAEEYLRAIRQAYRDSEVRFTCEKMLVSEDGSRIVTLLRNDAGVRSLDVFDFCEGLIVREYEFILGAEPKA
jgi:ketosteroid isomerase-like protein